jgi:hypothetical protein
MLRTDRTNAMTAQKSANTSVKHVDLRRGNCNQDDMVAKGAFAAAMPVAINRRQKSFLLGENNTPKRHLSHGVHVAT